MQPISNIRASVTDQLIKPGPSLYLFNQKQEGDNLNSVNEALYLQCQETVKQQTQEIQKLIQSNLKKDQQLEKIQQKLTTMQEENTNYHDEIIDQTKILSMKFIQLKNEEKKVKQLQETVKSMTHIPEGHESQASQQELAKEQEQFKAQRLQMEQKYELQQQEILQLNKVKDEQDLQIKEFKQNIAIPPTEKAFVDVLSKEEVGSPEDSQTSDVDRMEQELEDKDAQIQQLVDQLQEVQGVYEKIKFLEDKNENLKQKLQTAQSESTKNFWDLDIRCRNASLLSLVNDKWQFEIKNPDGLGDYQQQISVFGFDSQVMQQFTDVAFNYSKQSDGIYNTITSQAVTHLKALTPSFLHVSKVSKKLQTFLLSCKLLSRQHYSKGSVRQVDKQADDQSALEEFWFQFCFNQIGTVIFVCNTLGLEEIELIKRLTFLQVTYTQQRFIIVVIDQKEPSIEDLNTSNLMCQELQIVQDSLDAKSNINAQRVLLNLNFQKQPQTDIQVYLQNIIKNDQAKLKLQFSFVDQIREYIVQSYSQYFECPEDVQPDFKIEQPNDEVEGFDLTLVLQLDQKPKLKRNRLTTIITSQSVVNTKYEDNGEVHIEVFAPAGEIIKKYKVKPHHIQGQGTKLCITLCTDFGSGQEEPIKKYRYIQMIPQWFVKTKNLENLKFKLVIVLQQDSTEQQQ